jgi:hypothetical protein
MQLSWLGQFGPANCPPGTKRDLQSGLCFPDVAAAIEAAKPRFNTNTPILTPVPTAEEKRNQMVLIAGGVVLAGLIAYAVLR